MSDPEERPSLSATSIALATAALRYTCRVLGVVPPSNEVIEERCRRDGRHPAITIRQMSDEIIRRYNTGSRDE